ncbi:MAG: hypothetical protein A2W25_05305 [candidate division Zixibacteria bacterium RBG_16_53_22]|nr:MAG: hypothetical protein A2W25_05305 [candidate division Zixibacteria bacterium RBG_16_53_22]
MKETELAEFVIDWLSTQNWNIYQEVEFNHHGGIADICAERHGILWIIETKMAMSIEVLRQASKWPVHFRSIAIPKAINSYKRDYFVARDYYRVGVIEVSKDDIYEAGKPPLYLRHDKTAKRLLLQLTELHKTFAKAGSKGNGHLTPYKMTMMDIASTLRRHPGCTVDDLFKIHGPMHYANKSSFKGNILKCLEDFEKDWCRIDKTSKPYRLYIGEGDARD